MVRREIFISISSKVMFVPVGEHTVLGCFVDYEYLGLTLESMID